MFKSRIFCKLKLLDDSSGLVGLATIPTFFTLAQTLLIVLLVHFGRQVQPYLPLIATPIISLVSAHVLIFGILGLGLLLLYYRCVFKLGVRYILLHLVACVGIITLAHSMMELLVETMHIVLYAALFLSARLAVANYGGFRPALLALCYSVAVGLLDETLQGLHPARIFDVRDLLFNFLGAALALLVLEPWLLRNTNEVKNCNSLVEDPRR